MGPSFGFPHAPGIDSKNGSNRTFGRFGTGVVLA
jgi:hypothetical protein